jgi:hypothetical protein
LIELPLNASRYKHMIERLLVPKRIWMGGWNIAVWDSRERRWWPLCDTWIGINARPFLKHQENLARAELLRYRAIYPRMRFRLQPIGAPWLLRYYGDIIWNPHDPDRAEWFEKWGGGSPLWRMLGRQPA